VSFGASAAFTTMSGSANSTFASDCSSAMASSTLWPGLGSSSTRREPPVLAFASVSAASSAPPTSWSVALGLKRTMTSPVRSASFAAGAGAAFATAVGPDGWLSTTALAEAATSTTSSETRKRM
jgi:hypothetical protein